ncbi:hypothetical protein [uncultured Dialister sp.]|uniref:hypothetical protein n=1 Tax=uncultured Dialister sp. TaxID=278064 RepID=UPI0027DE04A2|nr:hypothetical protein [uncultured Dialister sp.]
MSVFHGVFACAPHAFGLMAKQTVPAPEKLHLRELGAKPKATIIPWQALVLFHHGAKSYEWA